MDSIVIPHPERVRRPATAPEAVNPSDCATLCRRIASGDAEAFSSFFDQWFDDMLDAARRCSGRDESFAMDVVQDALMKVIAHIRPFETEDAMRRWLSVVVKRCAFDRLRAERRRAAREAAASATRAEAWLDQRDDVDVQIERLRAELAGLGADDRCVLDLRWRAGWTLERIGRALGLSPGAVDGRVRRALAHLRARLKETPDD